MIKKIESYPELADPQLRPRYSGIPTFFRLAHSIGLDDIDIGLVAVPFDPLVAKPCGHTSELGVTGHRYCSGIIMARNG